jgi:hypothetical protein
LSQPSGGAGREAWSTMSAAKRISEQVAAKAVTPTQKGVSNMKYTKPMIEVLNQAHHAVLSQLSTCNNFKGSNGNSDGCIGQPYTDGAYSIDE